MHETTAIRVVDLHDGDLVLGGHQQGVLTVENGRQVHAPAHTSLYFFPYQKYTFNVNFVMAFELCKKKVSNKIQKRQLADLH